MPVFGQSFVITLLSAIVELQRITLRHIDYVYLFQKGRFVKLIKLQNFCADPDLFLWLMVPPTGQPAPIFFFLLAAAVPELLNISIFYTLIVHIALPTVGTFDFARKAGSVQALIGQRSHLPALAISSCTKSKVALSMMAGCVSST